MFESVAQGVQKKRPSTFGQQRDCERRDQDNDSRTSTSSLSDSVLLQEVTEAVLVQNNYLSRSHEVAERPHCNLTFINGGGPPLMAPMMLECAEN